MSFFEELKRRNVVKVGVLYIVASWLILQVGDVLFDALDLPSTWLRLVLALLILGFPLALIFSWVYELTPEGIKREKDIDR
ncbi:MAG: adenylyl cyclase, partial [Gammaproteobacteria bacterium]